MRLLQGVAALALQPAERVLDIGMGSALLLGWQPCSHDRSLRALVEKQLHVWTRDGLREFESSTVDVLPDTHEVDAAAVLGHTMVLRVQDAVADVVPTELLQGLHDYLQTPALLNGLQPLHVLEHEDPRPVLCHVVAHIEEDLATPKHVLETLLLPCCREGLAGEAGNVDITRWRRLVVACHHIAVHLPVREVRLNSGAGMRVLVTTEAVLEANPQVLHGLHRRFHPRAVSPDADDFREGRHRLACA
mmetsp:Transcript_139249/g.347130  ORF Transcript_139249/g.347130 Transcript_139249/m.347130 type:complete len:247 (-) Transcript_139249:66-806(-)